MNDFKNHNEEKRQRWEERRHRWEARWERRMEQRQNSNGHIWAGLFLLAIGAVALARSMGVMMPNWLFSWQMLLIAIGFFIGLKKGFRDGGWFVPIIIGGAFLANDYFLHGELRRHIWPLVLIVLGLVFIFHPRKHKKWREKSQEKKSTDMNTENVVTAEPLNTKSENFSEDDFIETTSIFGGTEKVILSKNFKGGSMTNVFGGSEINLTQADMTSTAVLDVTCIFGGATLIVPANWAVKSEAVTIFGGISDKRSAAGYTENMSKNLVIKGTVIFGGLEIKSY